MRPIFGIDQTWLECIGCGAVKSLLDERQFKCEHCGNLFDVKHKYPENLKLSDYQALFNFRANSVGQGLDQDPRISSGVWRFKEWIMPYLPNTYIVTLNEGNVPIVPAGRHLQDWIGGDIDLYIILEGMTPTGSFKDLGGTVMISIAKAIGINALGCSSTGDTSAMAAAYAAAAGMTAFVLLPKGYVTSAQLAQPLVHGAKAIMLPGNFDACMRAIEALVEHFGVFPANSLNPTRIEGHQATVFLIAQYFMWRLPNWIVVPIGNGSNSSSVGKGLRLVKHFGIQHETKILGCQSRAARPLAASWNTVTSGHYRPIIQLRKKWEDAYRDMEVGETTATAARIGAPVSKDKVIREVAYSKGAMMIAEEEQLNEAVAVCGKDGHFVCPQTGIALAGVKNAVRKNWIKKDEKVVVVSTATGLKFTDSAAASLQKEIIDAEDCKPETVAKILGL